MLQRSASCIHVSVSAFQLLASLLRASSRCWTSCHCCHDAPDGAVLRTQHRHVAFGIRSAVRRPHAVNMAACGSRAEACQDISRNTMPCGWRSGLGIVLSEIEREAVAGVPMQQFEGVLFDSCGPAHSTRHAQHTMHCSPLIRKPPQALNLFKPHARASERDRERERERLRKKEGKRKR